LDSWAMKDSGVVGGVSLRRWRVRAGMVDVCGMCSGTLRIGNGSW
jgi:uncharacterized phage protein gp47/JayE